MNKLLGNPELHREMNSAHFAHAYLLAGEEGMGKKTAARLLAERMTGDTRGQVQRDEHPDVLAFDEITAPRDCDAMLKAGWCGIKLIATAHAGSKEDLVKRPLYRPIVESALFDTLVIMRPDKSWSVERMIK